MEWDGEGGDRGGVGVSDTGGGVTSDADTSPFLIHEHRSMQNWASNIANTLLS